MATAAALILCAGEIQDALVNETNLEVVQNKFLKAPLSFSGNTVNGNHFEAGKECPVCVLLAW